MSLVTPCMVGLLVTLKEPGSTAFPFCAEGVSPRWDVVTLSEWATGRASGYPGSRAPLAAWGGSPIATSRAGRYRLPVRERAFVSFPPGA